MDGFRVLDVDRKPADMTVTVETMADVAGCPTCSVRAEAQDRLRVDIRDLPCFGRTVRLVWLKRRWRRVDADCPAKTWTEGSEHVAPRAVLNHLAGAEATCQVGELAMLQPFQRLDPLRTHHGDGHGLGLSIVAAIADAHGATITANPGPQGGLSVDVAFPSSIDREGTVPQQFGGRPPESTSRI
jgi:hypothetical protein